MSKLTDTELTRHCDLLASFGGKCLCGQPNPPDMLAAIQREAKVEALREMASECGTVFDSDLPHVTQNELLAEADRIAGKDGEDVQ